MQDKTCKKAKSKNQSINIRRLVLNNSRAANLGIFKDILSNLSTAPLKPDKTLIFFFNQFFDNDLVFSLSFKNFDIVNSLTAAKLKSSKKKKAYSKIFFRHLSKKP